jgi:hypothetical protein
MINSPENSPSKRNEKKPVEKKDTVKALGKAAIKGATKK